MSRFPMTDINFLSRTYQMSFIENSPMYKSATFEASDVQLTEDLSFSYGFAVPGSTLGLLAYRAPERISADELRDPRLAQQEPDGYFEAAAVFNEAGRRAGEVEPAKPRSVLVMLDTSLSMNWEKLDRAYETTEALLGSLTPRDSFNLILFNDDVLTFVEKAADATPENIGRALAFIKGGYLSGGTDLAAAFDRAATVSRDMPSDKERVVVLITDGNSTLTTTRTKAIVERFQKANEAGPRARLYVFGIGSDINIRLLEELARSSRGYFDWTRETDDLTFKLKTFLSKIGRAPIDSLKLENSDADNLYHVYPDYESNGLRRLAALFCRPLPQARRGARGDNRERRGPRGQPRAVGNAAGARRHSYASAEDVGASESKRAAQADSLERRDQGGDRRDHRAIEEV